MVRFVGNTFPAMNNTENFAVMSNTLRDNQTPEENAALDEIIKGAIHLKSDFSQGIDTRNPLHAAAYLKAASHFLSGWPQEWNAETLALALVDDESRNQAKVKLWEFVKRNTSVYGDPYLESDSLISNLAESFLAFLEENSKEENSCDCKGRFHEGDCPHHIF